MKDIARISFSLVILLIIIDIVPAEEGGIRSDIHDISENIVTWNCYTFPGFYYDLNSDIGTETLTFQLSPYDRNNSTATLSDQIEADGFRGAVYETKAFPYTFSFDLWGQYDRIDFLGKDYLAGYNSSVWSSESVPILYDKSKNRSLMANGQLSEILWDDNTEHTIDSYTPLDLDEGYRLIIKAIDADGKKVYLKLIKNNKIVDSKVVSPSIENATIEDATYYYKKDLGATKDIVLLAVHFKNVFRSAENNVATIDGVFQISEKPITISTGKQYGEMSIRSIDAVTETISLDNKDHPITLTKNKDIKLMGDFYIRTADQSDSDYPLRYYLYYNNTSDDANQDRPQFASPLGLSNKPSNGTVNAKEILEKIENDMPVKYDHVRVIGDLNLSDLDLPPEQVYRSLYDIEDLGLLDKQKVVTSSIRINDSEIDGDVSFKNIIFNGSLDFNSTSFDRDADFKGSDFYRDVKFENSTFKKKADFRGSRFHDYIGFYNSKFNDDASFYEASFNAYADFVNSKFNKNASFAWASYMGESDFEKSSFNGTASFNQTTFNNNAYFWNSTFNKIADIRYSTFNNQAIFDDSRFKGEADFGYSSFNDAYFWHTVFDRKVEFNRTIFNSAADFSNSNFSGKAYFFDSYFGNSCTFSGVKSSNLIDLSNSKIDIFIADWQFAKPSNHKVNLTIGVLQNLRGYYERYGTSDDANDCYYVLRAMKAGNSNNLLDNLAMISYGYGVKPLRPLVWSIIIIFLFALIFWRADIFKFKESIYFSFNTFVSGAGKLFVETPKLPEISTTEIKFLFDLERILGLIFISLLVITFTKTVFLSN